MENVAYYLEPIRDHHKSFYKKAEVVSRILSDGVDALILFSYDTPVAWFNRQTDEVVLLAYWNYSNTTLRHVKEFVFQMVGWYPNINDLRKAWNDGGVVKALETTV